MSMRLAIVGIIVVVAGVLLSDSFFTVRETQQALVLRFGNPVREPINAPETTNQDGLDFETSEAGLHFKLPFIDDVVYYERRVLEVDPPAEEVTLRDQRRLVVDAFIRYRISDPLQFLQRVRTEANAVDRLTTILNAALRNVLARYEQSDLLSSDLEQVESGRRDRIMQEIQRVVAFGLQGQDVSADVAEGASDLGITIVDVRIGRADVPDQTRESIFTRMRSEREREAGEIRATGNALAERLRAFADRWRVGFLARAERLSQIIQGEGDQTAIATLASAHGLDPRFFSFYRTLEAYGEAMANQETALVLSPDGDFFRYFQEITGGDAARIDLPDPDPALRNEVLRRLIPAEAGALAPTAPATGTLPDAATPPDTGLDGDGDAAGPDLGSTEDGDAPIPTDLGSIDQELQGALSVPPDLQGLVGDDVENAIDSELTNVLGELQADEERLIDPTSNAELFNDPTLLDTAPEAVINEPAPAPAPADTAPGGTDN